MISSLPMDILYTSEHEWAKKEGAFVLIGITDHAQHALGDVVYVELPEVGTAVEQGRPIGVVESVKAVSDIYAPISGTIRAVNKELLEKPELLNQDPYGKAWMLQIEPKDLGQLSGLLKHEDYRALLSREAKEEALG